MNEVASESSLVVVHTLNLLVGNCNHWIRILHIIVNILDFNMRSGALADINFMVASALFNTNYGAFFLLNIMLGVKGLLLLVAVIH